MQRSLALAASLVLMLAATQAHAHGKKKGHSHAKKDAAAQAIGATLPHYLRIQRSLSKDSIDGVADAAAKLATAAKKHGMDDLAAAAGKLEGKSLEAVREAFKAVSEPVVAAVHAHASANKAYDIFYCGVVKARWVQQGKSPRNPYSGKHKGCGKSMNKLPAPAPK